MKTMMHADIRETDSLSVRDAGRTDPIFFSSFIGSWNDEGSGVFLRVDPELVPKLFVVIRANAASISSRYTLDEICAVRVQLGVSISLKENFNGDGAVFSYLDDVRTTKETTMDKEGSARMITAAAVSRAGAIKISPEPSCGRPVS
jgi:hypothetical protein